MSERLTADEVDRYTQVAKAVSIATGLPDKHRSPKVCQVNMQGSTFHGQWYVVDDHPPYMIHLHKDGRWSSGTDGEDGHWATKEAAEAAVEAWRQSAAARAASGLTLLTAEQREWIERYTDFKTDASPITKAMRKALAIIDTQAAALAAEEKNCIALHKANQKQIAIIQEQRASLAERGMTIHEQLVIIATLEEQLADAKQALGDFAELAEEHGWSGDPETVLTEFLDSQIRVGWRATEQLAAKERECESNYRKVFDAGFDVCAGYGDNRVHYRGEQADRVFAKAMSALNIAPATEGAEDAERPDITTFVNACAQQIVDEDHSYMEVKATVEFHMAALADWISNRPPQEQARG